MDKPLPSPFKRLLRIVLFGVVCLATLIALVLAEENWRGKHAWLKHRQELEARGEKLELDALTPPPVPEEKNFAATPLFRFMFDYTNGPEGLVWRDTNAEARLQRLTPEQPRNPHANEGLTLGRLEQGTFADLKACADFYRGNTNYPQAATSASPAQVILTALSKFDPELQELRQAATERPGCRFPIHYGDEPSWSILLPHLAHLNGLTRLTRVRALAEMDAGQPAEALSDLQLGMRLSECIRTEPLFISHLVRLATLTIDLQTVREGLHRHAWNDAQLTQIEADLAKVDCLAEYQFAMRGERALAVTGFEEMRRQGFRSNPGNYVGDQNGSSAPPLNLVPGGWICQNLLTICLWEERYAMGAVDEHAHRVFPEISNQGCRALQQMGVGPYTIFAKMLLPALTNAVTKSPRAQVYVDCARVACALERYRLAEGKLPQNPAALVPRFLPAIPNDVIDGQPLRYRPQANGSYLLYSIGWNQTDDGGVIAAGKQNVPMDSPRAVDATQGDWVWKME